MFECTTKNQSIERKKKSIKTCAHNSNQQKQLIEIENN